MQPPHQHEQNAVGNGLVELSWVTWQHVDTLEDKGPGDIRHLADNLGVHQVAQADEAGCRSCGDGDVVEHLPDVQLGMLHIEP